MNKGCPMVEEENIFFLVDITPTSVRNMLLGLEMVDQVDQSFVKVYFHKMTMEYSN